MNYRQILNTPIRSLRDCVNLCDLMKMAVMEDRSGKITLQIREFLDSVMGNGKES